MEGFHMHLLSNASGDLYPENTTRAFKIQLPKTLNLKGQWGMSLKQILYPATLQNVIAGENQIEILDENNTPFLHFEVPPAHYPSIEVLIIYINRLLQDHIGENVFLSEYGPGLLATAGPGAKNVSSNTEKAHAVKMSLTLARQLGFNKDIFPLYERSFASHFAQTSLGFPSQMLIYCDLLASSFVGHALTPLLSTVPISIQSYGNMVCHDVQNPHYVPLNTHAFSTIEININDDAGRPLPFEYGSCTLLVHLKPLRNAEQPL